MVVFDLDNCLSRDLWRRDLIDWSQQDVNKRYHRYHLQLIHDPAEPFSVADMDLISRQRGFIIISSRPKMYEGLTRRWWGAHYIRQPRGLFLRPKWDFSSCPVFKARMLDAASVQLGIPVNEFICFDDRPEVVEAYRRAGAVAHVRALDGYEGYTPQRTL